MTITTENPALHSVYYDLDVTRQPESRKGELYGEIIKMARERGIVVKHRQSGWATEVQGERKSWWPAQGNLFVDYLANQMGLAPLPTPKVDWASMSPTEKMLAQTLFDVLVELGYDTDGDTTPAAEIAGMGLDAYAKSVLVDVRNYRIDAEDGDV
jgi:hypothetical protein